MNESRPADRRPRPARSRAQRLRAERRVRRLRLRRVLEVAAAALSIVLGVSLTVVFTRSADAPTRGAQRSATAVSGASLRDPNAASAFLGSAASDIAAVTTYDYRHLDDALSAGLSVTTGTYREQYRVALTGDLARTATAEHVVHTFEVLDVGIGAMNAAATQAKVLVFGNERVIDDRTGPRGDVSPVTLCATITRSGNRYLLSNLVQNVDPGLPPAGPGLAPAAAAARSELAKMLGSVHVTAMAVVRAAAQTVTLMVAADQTRTGGTNQPTVVQHRYEITVTGTEAGWTATQVVSVDGGV